MPSIEPSPPPEAPRPREIQTFTLSERFGVAYPDQVVEFDYPATSALDPATTCMIGPDGLNQVVFQILSGNRIAVRTDLPPKVTRQWHLTTGCKPAAATANAVSWVSTATNDEITNGLTGVWILNAAGNPRPYNRVAIGGIRLADGTWTAASSPNYLYTLDKGNGTTPVDFASGYSTTVVDAGPLETTIKAVYTFNRPEEAYGVGVAVTVDTFKNAIIVPGNQSWHPHMSAGFSSRRWGATMPCGLQENKLYWVVSASYDPGSNEQIAQVSETIDGPPVPIACAPVGPVHFFQLQNLAGPGTFSETVTLFAGHKSIVIDDDLDTQVQYYLNFYDPATFDPDQARWRGHSSTSAACGHNPDGSIYSTGYTSDAFVDVSATVAKAPDYRCSPSTFKWAPNWYMANTGRDSGWYWQFYNSNASRNAPLIGFYIGRTSQTLGDVGAGPSLYSGPAHFAAAGAPAFGLSMFAHFRSPDGTEYQRSRREWAIFVSTKADLLGPTSYQPIGLERNLIAGINLTRLAHYALTFSNPPGGWPPPYLDQASFDRFVARLQTDPTYYAQTYNVVAPEIRDLLAMWKANDNRAIETMVQSLEDQARDWNNILVNQNGNYDSWWQYYQPGLKWSPNLARILAVLNNPLTTPAQKDRVKAVAAFVGSVFWDDDYVPWDFDTGESHGNANQDTQYSSYRAAYALDLTTQPLLATKQTTAKQYVEAVYTSYLDPLSGVPHGSTAYHVPAMDPALTNFLLLKNSGLDLADYPLWKGYAAWIVNALTPPEPRFGLNRKMVSLGDGNTEGQPVAGMLATLLRPSDPALSAQLQWAWTQQGQPQGSFSAPSVMVIDDAAPVQDPRLQSINFPGYWSIERFAAGTAHETALWFVNGNWYSDHRHADAGEVVIYAHSAPLALDFNANLYYPETNGSYVHNRVVRESDIGQAWDADNAPLSSGTNGAWAGSGGGAQQQDFESFTDSSQSTATFTASDGGVWTRTVRTMAPDVNYPVIFVKDTFTGAKSTVSKVLTWNLMARGVVQTPAGAYTPIERLNTTGTAIVNAYPSNGPVYPLERGLDAFGFTGQIWNRHATKGIDWDLYALSDGRQRFLIGNWGHNRHSGAEMSQYKTANGSSFTEVQDLLRIQGNGDFTTIILPYRKGEKPTRTVTKDACGIKVVQNGEKMCFDDHSFTFSNDVKLVATSYDSRPVSDSGLSVSGGPTEITVTSDTTTIVARGPRGARTFTVPGSWSVSSGAVSGSGTNFALDYQDLNQGIVTLTRAR